MRLNWNFLRLAMLAAVLLPGAGCSGINASKSVSPLDFLLPGIIKTDSPKTNLLDSFPEIDKEFATVR